MTEDGSSQEDLSLQRYWTVVRERFRTIAGCTVLVLIIAIVYLVLAPRTYQAQAEMEIQAASSNDTTLSSLPVLHASGDPTTDVLTGASLITTEPVASAVVKALKLDMSPSAALGHVSATPIGQTSIVAVVGTGSSPLQAKQLANAFVTQTIALSTARLHTAINAELPALRAQLSSTPTAERYGTGSLGAEIQELDQLLQGNDPTLTSVASASLPTAPSSPKTKLTILAALIGGLLIGIAAAFIQHALDPLLRREQQVREKIGLSVLARIPDQPRIRSRPLLPSEMTPVGSEGYRRLKAMMTARVSREAAGAFLITGSTPAEGKTTTAIGLATALAQAGERVVLIEADLRRPTFATTLDLENYIGTEEVLRGRATLQEACQPVTVSDSQILVLAAHPPLAAIPDLISSESAEALIAEAKRVADYVVVDSAPLTAVIDALPLVRCVDSIVIVSRLGVTRLKRLAELDDLLARSGGKDVSVVVVGGSLIADPRYYYNDPSTPPVAPRAAATAATSWRGDSRPAAPERRPLFGP